MPLVDSHCHLQDGKFDADREEVISRALEDLDWLVVIGDDIPTSCDAVNLTRERVYAAVGIHPYDAAEVNADTLDELRVMSQSEPVVAIGEIGLDYFKYNDTPRDIQQTAFRQQLDLACEVNLPVVIHNRESFQDMSGILDEYRDRLPGGVIHCFAGTPEFVRHVLDCGLYISFAGNVTFPRAEELRIAAREVPRDRILVETDAPYLAPQAVRGKRCEPAYTRHTAEFLAEYLDLPYEEFSAQTAGNAARLFNISM